MMTAEHEQYCCSNKIRTDPDTGWKRWSNRFLSFLSPSFPLTLLGII